MATPTSPKLINGPIHAVPCPWCGKPNDCRGLQQEYSKSFEAGTSWECDHCHNLIINTKVTEVTVVQVRQHGPLRHQIPKR